MATLLLLPANVFTGDTDAQLVAGDAPATPNRYVGRPGYDFDDTDEESVLSAEVRMPSGYTGSGLTATLEVAANVATGGMRWEVYVESKQSGTDTTPNMLTGSSWAAANGGTVSAASPAGRPIFLAITITNDDGLQPGRLVRFGVRRHASNAADTLVGDAVLFSLEISDDG